MWGGVCLIGDNVTVRDCTYLEIGRDATLNIGKEAFFNRNCQIVAMNSICLGEHIAVGTNVSFFDHDHVYVPNQRQQWGLSKKGSVEVGRDVWIGAQCIILRKSKIGHNTVIGAGSVVNEEVPENVLYIQERGKSLKKLL